MASLSSIAVSILVLDPLVVKDINMKIFKVVIMPTDIQFLNLQGSDCVVMTIDRETLNHAIRLSIHKIVVSRKGQTFDKVTGDYKSIAVAINFDS